jgi:hypothetical protein
MVWNSSDPIIVRVRRELNTTGPPCYITDVITATVIGVCVCVCMCVYRHSSDVHFLLHLDAYGDIQWYFYTFPWSTALLLNWTNPKWLMRPCSHPIYSNLQYYLYVGGCNILWCSDTHICTITHTSHCCCGRKCSMHTALHITCSWHILTTVNAMPLFTLSLVWTCTVQLLTKIMYT